MDGTSNLSDQELLTQQPETPWAWIKCVRDMCDPTKNPSLHSVMKDKELPVPLLPWLYLGDRQSARRLAKMSGNHDCLEVTHILALHPVAPYEEADMQERLNGSGICHLRINCDDTEGYDMIGKHWETCHAFLQNVRDKYNDYLQKSSIIEGSDATAVDSSPPVPRVLVHCVAGINRSGLIACAAQMVLERQPLLEVVQSCVMQRGSVLWNRSFQGQLCQLAQEEGLLGPIPKGYDNSKPKCWDNFDPPPPAHNVVVTKQEAKFRLAQLLQSRSRIVQTEESDG
uniref:Tyrosine specific protein phosphatases domain-containing protein n=1 Tax=Entomoneis paludosa TaxID=265537 RepID=A0A7S2V9V7_9STRA|mmetsp:Transcript_13704/g.28305  ORF Transcript_13704/g.28305 Transcript_13704/m.28305 type:complete len:284 (+) Transcript_13704:138-989(+)|eukprot:CAMPEP_0172457804 /NCGR_PEP_ID=MMETSP1065-20121228/24293_1 /TAXON_ID=265537 /ORGANISM="Amphiprora paludosa, Strain CCMP125" /LENGTH=283 /DNA_ID=CAMNT_0013211741 /DNA_START=91 /DNA_END=942 /DNA_ORIENTATION=+